MASLQKKNMKDTVNASHKNGLRETVLLSLLFLFFLPSGIVRMWKSDKSIVLKICYALSGLPLFILSYSFLGLVLFAAFLPALDLSVGDRKDRTIVNSAGNYSVAFLKTARETDNVYELVQVEVEPNGGNGPHYHKDFEEHFTVIQGTLTVYVRDVPHRLTKGDTITAVRQTMHYFRNETDSTVLMTVRTTPAGGLEKTLRVAYGLINSGKLVNDFTENPWHMCLLLGYSGSYLEGLPGFIQEPLVISLAKVAQWKGEDKSLEVFFK
jgi:quercetin dioxygenase-like cupin family protein